MSPSVISPICWWRMMPLPSIDEGLGHAGRAERELDPAVEVGADRAGTDRHRWRGSGRGPRAGRGRRCRRSGRRAASSAISCGASARHGTHQLAKTLTRCGWPRRSDRRWRGRDGPATAGGRAKSGTRLADHAASGCSRLGRRVEAARRRCRRKISEHGQRQPEDQPALHAGASCRAARRRSRRSRPISASRPPSATSAPPSQIRVTNGFHHRRSCQRPCSVRLADRDVELAVEAGGDRRLAGLGRRRAEHAAPAGRSTNGAPSPRRAVEPRLDRGPVRPGDRLDAVEADAERADLRRSGPGARRPGSPW